MAKALDYDGFIDYAKKHYCKGGDVVYECWDEDIFDEYVMEFGPITKRKALDMFRLYRARESEMAGMADW